MVPALAEDAIGPLTAAAVLIPWGLLEQRHIQIIRSSYKISVQSQIPQTLGAAWSHNGTGGVWSPNASSNQTPFQSVGSCHFLITLWHMLSKEFSLPPAVIRYSYNCNYIRDECFWPACEDLLWYIVNNVQEIILQSISVTSWHMEIQIRYVGSTQSMHDGCNKHSFIQVLRNEI